MDPKEDGHKTDYADFKDKTTGRFVIGNPGGPGRAKGTLSIKELIKQYLIDHPGKRDEFVEYFVNNNRELGWQMLEGRPSQQVDLGVDKEGIEELTKFFREVGKSNDRTGTQSTGV